MREFNMKAMEKSAGKEMDKLKEALRPIRALANKNPMRRQAIVMAVINELMTWRADG